MKSNEFKVKILKTGEIPTAVLTGNCPHIKTPGTFIRPATVCAKCEFFVGVVQRLPDNVTPFLWTDKFSIFCCHPRQVHCIDVKEVKNINEIENFETKRLN